MSEMIKEYLVALGFKVDENGWKGFNSKIVQSTANVAALGAETVATAQVIGLAVEKVARQYTELYYVSQRTGSSVSTLKTYEYAAKQIGLTADQSRASVESMASAMRLNPGLKAMMNGMGIDSRDPQKAIVGLVERLKSQYGQNGYFVASRMAGMFGLDENTFLHIWNNLDRLKVAQEAQRKRQIEAGLDPDKMAERSVNLTRQWDQMTSSLEIFKDRMIDDFIGPVTKSVEALTMLIDLLNKWNSQSDGWIGKIFGVAAAFVTVKTSLGVIARIAALLGIGGGTAGAAGGAASMGLRALAFRALGPVGAFAWGLGLGGTANTGEKDLHGGPHPSDAGGGAGLQESIRKTAKDLGISPVDLATAISYETAGSFDPWKKGPTTQWGQHRGLIQWGEPQRKKYGVTEGMSPADQMEAVGRYLKDAGVKPGMGLLDVYSAINAGRVGRYGASDANNGGAPGSVADKVAGMAGHRANAERLLGGGTVLAGEGNSSNVTIAPNITNHVSGVSDPKKAAGLIGAENDRAVGNLTRWGKSAIDNGAMPQ